MRSVRLSLYFIRTQRAGCVPSRGLKNKYLTTRCYVIRGLGARSSQRGFQVRLFIIHYFLG
jgi:hypothetical protein